MPSKLPLENATTTSPASSWGRSQSSRLSVAGAYNYAGGIEAVFGRDLFESGDGCKGDSMGRCECLWQFELKNVAAGGI